MDQRIDDLLQQLEAAERLNAGARHQCAVEAEWLVEADAAQCETLLDYLCHRPIPAAGDPVDRLLAGVVGSLARRDPAREPLGATAREKLACVYRRFPPDSQVGPHVLRVLTSGPSDDALRLFAELVVTSPPGDTTAAAIALMPLFQRRDYSVEALFPRLLDGLDNSVTAASIVDLANFVTRQQMTDRHPAHGIVGRLTTLLGALAQQLGYLEQHPAERADTVETLQRQVFEGVALIVSLCDAVGLIGDAQAVAKLNQVMQLGHRRVRAEAAAALARLDDEAGRKQLLHLAAEPVARLRVLHYAEELGLLDQIDEQYQSGQARGEAELAAWLSDPTNLGVAPGEMELLDQRRQYWPGYDEPVECYLFRFRYHLPQGSYENVGIAGPMAHALAADLNDLTPEDTYAVFAGWHAEHDEITEVDVREMTQWVRAEADRLLRRLSDAGFEHIKPVKLGFFFGERVLVTAARRDGEPGTAVADVDQEYWIPAGDPQRPIGPDEAYWMVKGRKLLQQFNP